MNSKKLIKKYGLIFMSSYISSFVILVTLNPRFHFPTFPGDIKIGSVAYFPFTSALAIAVFTTVMLEAYKVFKGY